MKTLPLILLAALLAACGTQSASVPPALTTSALPTAPVSQEAPMTFSITSTGFSAGQPIPPVFSCRGLNVSPPLAWTGAPGAAKSFALILDDPDAPSGTFVHWVLYNLPAGTSSLPQAVPGLAKLDDGSLQGTNGAGGTGYTGPCPPSGTHHYHFKLYALDATLGLSTGATKDQLLKAMQGHILAQAELIGTFSK